MTIRVRRVELLLAAACLCPALAAFGGKADDAVAVIPDSLLAGEHGRAYDNRSGSFASPVSAADAAKKKAVPGGQLVPAGKPVKSFEDVVVELTDELAVPGNSTVLSTKQLDEVFGLVGPEFGIRLDRGQRSTKPERSPCSRCPRRPSAGSSSARSWRRASATATETAGSITSTSG